MKINGYALKRSTFNSWNAVFQQPSPIEIHSYQTGSVVIDLEGTLNPDHPNSPGLTGTLEVPIMAHLLSHNLLGNFLLDAGLDKSYYHDPYGGIETPLKEEFTQDKNQNIGYKLGDKSSKLEAVFLSHLHSDHIAGLRDLPNDVPVVVGKNEIENYQPELYGDFLADVKTVYELDFLNSDTIQPIDSCADLLGDGSLWAISTPGHTAGHISYLVNGLTGPTLLTMDAAFIPQNILYKVAPSDYTWNPNEAQRSLDRLCNFLEMFKGIEDITGHELP